MCKLHRDEIGKLEKKVMELSEVHILPIQRNNKAQVSKDPLEKTQAVSTEEIIKLIKDYMLNIDVESRIKKSEGDIKDFNSSIDLIKEMDRKIQTFTKEFDFGYLTKELQRRCLEDNTRK